MDRLTLLRAIGEIDDEYILSAQKKLGLLSLGRLPSGKAHKPQRIFRRIFIGLVAAIIMLFGSFTVALAVNEEFREAVFAFFHIEQTEVVPRYDENSEITADTMSVEPGRVKLGQVIEGSYVHTPAASNARNGIYLICTDPVEMKQGSHYDAYYEENGTFVKLEEHSFCQDYTILGNNFHVDFGWAAHNGSVVQTYVAVDVPYRKPSQTGSVNAVLFWFQCIRTAEDGTNTGTFYPVLIDLETGELTDILAGTGAEALSDVANAAISKDLSKMLLVQGDGTLYYADLAAKKLYSVNELSGEATDACSLIDDTLACWTMEHGRYRAWTIDLTTFERRELFDAMPNAASTEWFDPGIEFMTGFDTMIHWGNMYAGSYFALEVDENRNVYVIDLKTGERTQVEGFFWPSDQYPDIQLLASPDGKKLLLAGGHSGTNFQYIGVLDFESRIYAEFSRDNGNDVHEFLAYWFTNDQIIIKADAGEAVCDYYIYSLLS